MGLDFDEKETLIRSSTTLSSICFSHAMEPSNLVFTTLTSPKAATVLLNERLPDIDKFKSPKSTEWNDPPVDLENQVDILAAACCSTALMN